MDLAQYNNGQGYAPQAAQGGDGEGFTPIPPGIYQVRASFAEVRDNYDKDGKDLEITLDITGPSHAGRKIFKKIRLSGAGADAGKREKAMGNLASALQITDKLENTEQISGREFDAKVSIYNDKNYAHQLYPLGSQVSTEAATIPPPAAPPAAQPAWTPAATVADAPF